ncbi:MAG TPA: MerR family transcriptional regulator [Phototrophicaceae bacterium]|nr:MerR family transcriptional regulator [Phototrophicaceae bacterium]
MYTVKQLSVLAGVSVRTLHYYDEIGLLTPAQVGANSYRYYDDAALLRLQQILFYREIGLELMQIKAILDSPDFDVVTALRSHRAVLVEKTNRLRHLVSTVDRTIMHLIEGGDMSKKQLFQGFDAEKQKQYEREARLQWGPDKVNESVKRWNNYTPAQQQAVQEEGGQIYLDLTAALKAGIAPQSAEVQAILERWHHHLRYFYEPTLEILRGLGDAYNTPDFAEFFQRFHPDLPAYLQTAINQYVDVLEDAEIARLLADDEADRARG